MADNVVRLSNSPAQSNITTNTGEPDFITRVNISSMSDEQLDELITSIRTRRMSSFIIYQDTMEKKAQIQEEKARVRVEKQCIAIKKTVDMIDRNTDKLEDQINKLRGLRIQAGLDHL